MKKIICTGLVIFLLYPICLFSQDEFKEWNEPGNTQVTTRNRDSVQPNIQRLQPVSGEQISSNKHQHEKGNGDVYWAGGMLMVTILAGILIRYKATRVARPFFLVASVALLGFYRGSCPCPISWLQVSFLYFTGQESHPVKAMWFLALIPITYFGGRVWCGWVCHLGALQELLHFPGKFNFLSSSKAQKIMRYTRLVVFFALIAQLLVTQTILWNKVDPFKTAYNLMASNVVSWVLLAMILVISVFMYRPFCKTACPVGLVLGWMSKIPGTAAISPKEGCIGCKMCSTACKSRALTYNNKVVILNKQECITCGECIEACKLKSLTISPADNALTEVKVYPRIKA
ncbi:4Fe-4S binding protein [Chitinophagaceae bacterium LB-8]|uniref:4Fe-4S binding protein n=1 Tax=Paraflavisolibacter caeni TaxID=2982496 RepID=A0A9X3B7J3_9BACT|nr:4Fe-4S binding protein [Paraflavisolibacter caeni]MCU7549305.1 4Fe-4S binding protein [Paraflavisolibacter caeni]